MVAPDPIRAGEWKSLRATGEFERYLELAHRRGWEKILIVLDLEDDCCAHEAAKARERIVAWANGRSIDVSIVFIVKEFESMFLACCDQLTDGSQAPHQNPEGVRDAKGAFRSVIGRRYKETQDQEQFSKQMDLRLLARRSRSYRKLLKELSGRSYEEITALVDQP
jgi:hypothetical protein